MFGANAFGWPYFGEAYAGTAAGSALTLSLADSITATDSATKTVVAAHSDTLTLTDALMKANVLAKADSATLSDAVAKAIAAAQADTLTISDAADLVAAFMLSLDDTVALTDDVSSPSFPVPEPLIAVGGHAVVRTTAPVPRRFALALADTVALADAFTVTRKPDPEIERMFSDIEEMLALELIPA